MLSSLNKVAWNAFGEAQSWAAGRRNIGVSVLILLLTVANTYAQHTDEYEYMVNYPDNSTVTLTRYTGSARAVVIPDVIDDMPVTGIGDEVFSKCVNMTGVMIPESVTNIGFAAFYGCSGLTTIALPEGVVSIGASAFEACWELTAITIPPQVTRIEDSTFGYCRKLTRVELPDILVYIGVNAFYLCDSNRLVAGECEEHAFLVKRGAGNREHGLILERGGLPPLWKAGASSRTPQTGRSPSSVSPPPPSPDCASHQTRIRLAYPCH
jgi:hypothetical protein